MQDSSPPTLTVAALYAEREDRHRRDREAEEQLTRKRQEELAQFKKRLDDFKLTDERLAAVFDRIRRTFERGETELMLTSFPSDFCTDNGRAIINASAPPINKPDSKDKAKPQEPEWLATLPKGARQIFDHWQAHLKPGGFDFTARIINYPGGMPGDVGLFFSWPKSAVEQKT